MVGKKNKTSDCTLNMRMEKNTEIDKYIASFPEDAAEAMRQVRQTIISNAPGVEECISYAMPAYKLFGKPLVYFAGYKNHIGFYATPSGHQTFKEALAKYKQGKGSVQFPLSEKMPLDLISLIVQFRVEENSTKAKQKK
jgi:uncharacterized protein YdhG (YjbR/CyaY superfamily)